MPEENQQVRFHLLKTHGYRSYHVDGGMSTITAKGDLYVELYLERRATPTEILFSIEQEGLKEIKHEGKEGWIREIECGILLDIPAAIGLRDLLSTQINSIMEMLSASQNISVKTTQD
jgi:hypothetical protein